MNLGSFQCGNMSTECCLNVYGFEAKEPWLATQTYFMIGFPFHFNALYSVFNYEHGWMFFCSADEATFMIVIELGNKRCLPLSRCWREPCSAKAFHLSQNVLTLRSLMAVLNDFAFNGGVVPTHSGTGRPRILCGCVSPNEIFNHCGNSGRTDNLEKKQNPCRMKGLTAASVCCSANVGYKGRCESLVFFLQVGELLLVVVVHQSQDQRCGLLAEIQGHCCRDSVFCPSVCPTSACRGRHLPATGAAHAKDLSGGQRDNSVWDVSFNHCTDDSILSPLLLHSESQPIPAAAKW